MGKPVNSNVKRAETIALNTKINKEVFINFKDAVAYRGYPMNTVLEVFMNQYANNRLDIDAEDILKWKNDKSDADTLNTTFNKEIYSAFKSRCKENGDKYGKKFFVKHIILAFMEKYANGDYIMEYVNTKNIEKIE